MGLDTSHDCWHGPYSAFMRWRSELHYLLTGDPLGRDGYEASMDKAYPRKWVDVNPRAMVWPYDPEAGPLPLAVDLERYRELLDPIRVLMNHSDCSGEIVAEDCGPLADALMVLMRERMPRRALYDTMRPATERFIAGLRAAAVAGEPVVFG